MTRDKKDEVSRAYSKVVVVFGASNVWVLLSAICLELKIVITSERDLGMERYVVVS